MMAGAFGNPIKGQRRVASDTQPKAARIWDRNAWSGPWCVARLQGLSGDMKLATNQRRAELTRRRRMEFDQCSAAATVAVDGQPYCRVHAGEIALAALLDES